MANKRLIKEHEFERIAEVAGKDNCLHTRYGEYGLEYAVLLNGHLMASSDIDCRGDRRYYLYL
jgi:hypothetical protein